MSDEMINAFTSDERVFAGLILELENNAMLRLLLTNQEKIMTKLGLSFDPSEVYNVLAPVENKIYLPDNDRFADHIEKLSQLRMDRLWEWVQLHLEILNSNKNKE